MDEQLAACTIDFLTNRLQYVRLRNCTHATSAVVISINSFMTQPNVCERNELEYRSVIMEFVD